MEKFSISGRNFVKAEQSIEDFSSGLLKSTLKGNSKLGLRSKKFTRKILNLNTRKFKIFLLNNKKEKAFILPIYDIKLSSFQRNNLSKFMALSRIHHFSFGIISTSLDGCILKEDQ